MMFFWSLINTFKDLGRIKIGRLVVNTVLMGRPTSAPTRRWQRPSPRPVSPALVDVLTCFFGRNATPTSALCRRRAMGAAAPAARILLLCWFALLLLAMWLVTLLPGKSKGCRQSGHPGRPGRESYLNSAAPGRPGQDHAAFLSQYFGLQNKEW